MDNSLRGPWETVALFNAPGTKMPVSPAIVFENLDHVRSWPLLRMEFVLLMADLRADPKYCERARHIERLLSDARFPTVEQIYFIPKCKPSS